MRSCLQAAPTFAKPFKRPSRDVGRSLWQTVLSVEPWVCQQCCFKDRRLLHVSGFSRSIPAVNILTPTLARKSLGLISVPRNATLFSTGRDTEPSSSHDDLPSKAEGRRSQVSRRFSNLMDHMQSNIFIAGQRLNDLTGYSGIEALKRDIEASEHAVQSTRAALQEARAAYSAAISTRASSQREVNQLLQRKSAWSPEDLERFTALYRSDHANEQAESTARDKLSSIENESEEAAAKLSATILARYHEEQIWSDKIRRMSTWGTWGLMGVNVLLFLVFQVGVEPWRRKRLVKGFEEKVQEALEREAAASPAYRERKTWNSGPIESGDEAIHEGHAIAAVPVSNIKPNGEMDASADAPSVPTIASVIETQAPGRSESRTRGLRTSLRDIFSEQQMMVRRVDLTKAALEGAAAGVAFVGVLVLLLRPQ